MVVPLREEGALPLCTEMDTLVCQWFTTFSSHLFFNVRKLIENGC